MAMKITYPDESTEILKEAGDAKKTESDTMDFYDRDGRLVKRVRFIGLLRWETITLRTQVQT
jgi:hypothetical protein